VEEIRVAVEVGEIPLVRSNQPSPHHLDVEVHIQLQVGLVGPSRLRELHHLEQAGWLKNLPTPNRPAPS